MNFKQAPAPLALLIILSASTIATAQLPLRYEETYPITAENFGTSIRYLDDIDGDGCDDFVVGSTGNTGLAPIVPAQGKVFFYSGKTGILIRTLLSSEPGDGFGAALCTISDVDGDGIRDLVIGRPFSDNGTLNGGAIDLVSGATGITINSTFGMHFNNRLGEVLASVGDLNADGVDDFIAGTRFFNNGPSGTGAGAAYLYSGAALTVLALHQGIAPNESLGVSVGGLGDVDGDGIADYVIGAHGDSSSAPQGGAAHVYSGATHTVIRSVIGSVPNGGLGSSVAGAGDVDADGIPDVIVGQPGFNGLFPNGGRARVYSGLNGAVILTINGQASGDRMGTAVAGGADLDGDSLGEIAAATTGQFSIFGSTPTASYVDVRSGLFPMGSFPGTGVASLFGSSMDMRGDVNGDGFPDLLIGEPGNDQGGNNAGKFTVMSFAGKRIYGDDVGDFAQVLGLDWLPGAGDFANGTLRVLGATPNNFGLIGLSTGDNEVFFAGFTLLIDITPGNYLTQLFTYNNSGEAYFEANLRTPGLDGHSFFIQVVDMAPPGGISSSNAVELRFTL